MTSIYLRLTLNLVICFSFSLFFFFFLPNNMISNFLRSTRNLSSVHSGSGSGWGPLRSSSDPGRGESVLRSLLEPWSDCCKYPLKVSHWAAMALRSNFSSGQVVCRVNGAARSTQKTHQPTPREMFHVSSGWKKKGGLLPETLSQAYLPLGFLDISEFAKKFTGFNLCFCGTCFYGKQLRD